MKTIRFQLLLLALFVMVGCQKDEMSTSMKKGSYSLVASIENNDSTSRTAVDENGGVTWVATDAIGVFGTQTKNAKFESTGAGANVTFVGELESSHEEPTLAYYPYDKNASLDGNALSFTLPSEYSYTGQSYAPMLGIKQANGNFAFKHLVGLLKVTIEDIPQNATKFVITSKGNEPLPISGIAKVEDVTVDNAVLELQALPDSYSVTYNFSPTVFSSDKIFYIPLPVGTYERLVVSLIGNEDDIIFERSISNLKVERKAMIEMPVVGCEEGISYTLSDDVFPIYKSDENYITSVESNKITYKSNIPADRRPQVGQILLFSDVTEMFPTGFLGKVVNITENGNGFIVETEPAALDEAFWNLKINKTIDVFSGFDGKELYIGEDVSSRSIDVSDKFEYPLSIPINTSLKFQKDKINYYGSLVGSIHTGIVLSYNIFIDEGVLKDFEIKIKLNNSTLALDDIVFGFGKEGKIESKEGEKFIDIKRPLSVAILGPVVIIPTLNWGVMYNASGAAEFGFSLGYEGGLEASIYVDPTSPIPILLPAVNITSFKKMEQTDEGCYTKLQGDAAVGPFVGFEFNFYGIAPVGFRAALMLGASGEFVMVPDIYEIAKNTQIGFGIQTRVEGSIGLGLFKGWEVELNAGMTFDFPFYSHLYALPIFENLKYGFSENGDPTLTLQTKNQTLFYYKYGMKVYKKNGEEVYRKYFSDKYTNNVLNDHDEMIYVVKGLEPGETYIARPFITNIREGDIFTDLSLEFTVSENVNVTTGDVTEVSYNSASFDGTISGFNFESDFEYGILCSLENEITIENSFKLDVSKIERGHFTAFAKQLEEGKCYFYRAYVYKEGKYYWGDIKEFSTLALNIKTLEAENLKTNSAILKGVIEGANNIYAYDFGIWYSTNKDFSEKTGTLIEGYIVRNGVYSVNVDNLDENTTYYWCAYAYKDDKYYLGEIKSFTTDKKLETERDKLIALYNSTGGDGTWNSKWNVDTSIDRWWGVSINERGNVYNLNLQNNGLRGDALLSGFSELSQVLFYGNELNSITIKDCAYNVDIPNIETLNLNTLSYSGNCSHIKLTGGLGEKKPFNIGEIKLDYLTVGSQGINFTNFILNDITGNNSNVGHLWLTRGELNNVKLYGTTGDLLLDDVKINNLTKDIIGKVTLKNVIANSIYLGTDYGYSINSQVEITNSTINDLFIGGGCNRINTYKESTLDNVTIINCKSEEFQCNLENASVKTLTFDNCKLVNIRFGHILERLIIKHCDLIFLEELADLGNIYVELIDVRYKNHYITLSGTLEEVINKLRYDY